MIRAGHVQAFSSRFVNHKKRKFHVLVNFKGNYLNFINDVNGKFSTIGNGSSRYLFITVLTWRSAEKKIVNGYKIVNDAAINGLL